MLQVWALGHSDTGSQCHLEALRGISPAVGPAIQRPGDPNNNLDKGGGGGCNNLILVQYFIKDNYYLLPNMLEVEKKNTNCFHCSDAETVIECK